MTAQPRKFDRLKKRLQRVAAENNLSNHCELIRATCEELAIEPVELAAALLQMTYPQLFVTPASQTERPVVAKHNASKAPACRNVRYRLDVGNNQQISTDEIMAVLIDESGVDRKRIGYLEMRDNYTLVDLPEGMPADIFQLLTEATVRGHKLNIKRLKTNRKRPREFRASPQTPSN